jgi:hypothetical protein
VDIKMKKILITIFSTALILTGCQTKNGNIDDSLTNQTRGINHNLDEVEKNLNYKIYARGNETSLIKPATLNLITIGKEDKDIKLSNGFAVDISDVVDLFNEYLPGTYSEDDVLKLLREDENFKETNKQLDLNNTKNDIVKYYSKDKKLIVNFQGTSANNIKTESKDKWRIEGDKVKISILDPIEKESKIGEITLRLNNKNYKDGKKRSYYYVESVTYDNSKSEKEKNTPTNHNYEAAAGLAEAVVIGGNSVGQFGNPLYLEMVTEQRRKNLPGRDRVYSISTADYLDIVNALKERTYTMDEALDLLTASSVYRIEKGNSSSYKYEHNDGGSIRYFKGDDMIIFTIGQHGSYWANKLSDKSSWKIDGDRIIIPVIGATPVNQDKGIVGSVTLRLNNKHYSGGNRKSIYYVEKIERGENY